MQNAFQSHHRPDQLWELTRSDELHSRPKQVSISYAIYRTPQKSTG